MIIPVIIFKILEVFDLLIDAIVSSSSGGSSGTQQAGQQHKNSRTAVITEIKDRRSLQLLRVAGVVGQADFVIANELSSA